MSKEKSNYLFINSCALKIIAIVLMTIDHIGAIMEILFYEFPHVATVTEIMRSIGRLALPLFCFQIVEGVIHTKNFKRYIVSLSVILLIVMIPQIIMGYGLNFVIDQGNIFIDLILGAIAIKLLMSKNKWLWLLALLPLGYGILSEIFFCMQSAYLPIAKYFPAWIRTQYGWYGIALIIGFYLAYLGAKGYYSYLSRYSGISYETYKGTTQWRFVVNLFSVASLVAISMLWYIEAHFLLPKYVWWSAGLQNFAMLSGAFLLFYNGRRGYNALWFQYGAYTYYPIHLAVIYGISYLILYLM